MGKEWERRRTSRKTEGGGEAEGRGARSVKGWKDDERRIEEKNGK